MSLHTLICIGLGLLFVVAFVQAVIQAVLSLYGWSDPERMKQIQGPSEFDEPSLGFSLLLPARHELAVIGGTIERILGLDYPSSLFELIVICDAGDGETIAEVERALTGIDSAQARLVLFDDGPINKPHGLNVGLRASRLPVVGIFDAEDDPGSAVLRVADAMLTKRAADAVQLGVQLMDVDSSWYAVHNVLEYFFWYRSRMHFQTLIGAAPLGGNTVFVRRTALDSIGGWDERCLTEDADLGVRLLVGGAKIVSAYDSSTATREETPPTVAEFVRQRTRWNQGFLQVLKKGDWRRLPTRAQRAIMAYTLYCPLVQGAATLLWLPMVLLVGRGSIWLALCAWLPLLAVCVQLALSVVGLSEFGDSFGITIRRRKSLAVVATYIPYLLLLGISVVRALVRHLRRSSDWEKTKHVGAHRRLTAIDSIP